MKCEMKEYKAACRGCHGGCMHILSVADGKVISVRPDPSGPLNKGRACMKGMSIIEQMYHPDRLLYPLQRTGSRGQGSWKRISWNQAYDIIASKLNELMETYGPECISSISGTGRHHIPYMNRFFNALGTPNSTSAGALICLGPRSTAARNTAGIFAGTDYYGKQKPTGILVWGTSPDVSGPDGELQWLIKDAMREGTKLLVIDPFPSDLAQKADLWLRIRPGTDGALALGLLNILISEHLYDSDFVQNWTYGFEELKHRCAQYDVNKVSQITGVPADIIVQAAHWIASTKPLGLEWGNAFEQSTNAFQTCRAIFMIPAITGNWDIPGGFVESKEIAPVADMFPERVSQEKQSLKLQLTKHSSVGYNGAHPYAVLEAICTGHPYKIRALFSHANNSLLSLPDAKHTYDCLIHLDFFVYMDFFMTPTAELADIVLPAALWPEVNGVFCMPEFGDQAILCQQKIVQVGECKSDEEFFIELAQRMGINYGADTHEDLLNEILTEMGRRHPELAGIDFEQFKQLGYLVPPRTYYNYRTRGGFETPTGKFELWSGTAQQDGVDPLPYWSEVHESPVSCPDLAKTYPFILITGKRQQQYFLSNNRQILSLRKTHPFPLVTIHPDAAREYDINEGDWVFIESPRGRITQKAHLNPNIAPNVVHCEMGWWYPEDTSALHGVFESNANVLTNASPPYDEFGSYQLRALLCRIAKNEDRSIETRYYDWINDSTPKHLYSHSLRCE